MKEVSKLYYLSVPICVERIWGHEDLKKIFSCQSTKRPIGEVWMLSGYPNFETKVLKNGKIEIDMNSLTKEIFKDRLPRFPLLIKLLKARRWLSIQVHPNDEYAIKAEDEPWGKNEAWYFLECKKGSKIVNGLKVNSKQELIEFIDKGKIEDVLNFSEVRKEDLVYLRAGIVHALGPDSLVLEVQQTSDLTYRLYDWGSNRELHISKALDVIDFDNPISEVIKLENKFSSPYFEISKLEHETEVEGFSVLFLLENSQVEDTVLKKYSCLILPPNEKIHFNGEAVKFDLGEFWKNFN